MEDECAGIPIANYIGLHSKLRAILRADEQITQTNANDVENICSRKHINYENYDNALFNKQTYTHEMNMPCPQKHHTYGIAVNKKTLCLLDTKAYTEPDGITTSAVGGQQEQ